MAAHQAPPVPGILQARTLEWVAISFSSAWKWKVKVKSFIRVWLLATPWTAAHQSPPSMGFSRQEYWSGVPSPSPNLCLYWGVIHIPYYSSIKMYNSMAFGTFTGLSSYHHSGLWKCRIFTSPQKETLYSLTVTLLSPVPQLLVHTCCSVSQSCLTLCESMYCSTPDSLSITISLSLLRLMSIELVMPSNHLILCCPLFLLPSIFSSIRIFFQWVGSSHQVAKVLASFSFSISHWKDWCWHTLVCFFSMDLPTLDISYKWNHMIWGLLYLASFT